MYFTIDLGQTIIIFLTKKTKSDKHLICGHK